jgi:phosphoglycerate dehydrogenase-like enzyme
MRVTRAVISQAIICHYTSTAMPNLLILTEVQEAMRARYKAMLLEQFPQLTINVVGHHSLVEPYIADTDILLCFSPPMADHVVRDAPKLKWIQALGTGVDNIVDLPSLGKEVLVTNILGVGLIAEYLAPVCKALHMTVIGISATPRTAPGFDRIVARSDLVKVAGELDFLVTLAPPTAETRGIIDAKVLGAMKRSAYLINVARGGLVDEKALIAALENGTIAGAALDVFTQEPLPSNSPLWKTKNVTIFAHLGGYSQGYEDRAMPTIAGNMRKFLSNDLKSMINIVRKPASWGD